MIKFAAIIALIVGFLFAGPASADNTHPGATHGEYNKITYGMSRWEAQALMDTRGVVIKRVVKKHEIITVKSYAAKNDSVVKLTLRKSRHVVNGPRRVIHKSWDGVRAF